MLGSCCVHMCMCAMGQADAHDTYGIHVWDVAAGSVIVAEAGGVLHDTGGLLSIAVFAVRAVVAAWCAG